jgi:YD repeat-containing protein
MGGISRQVFDADGNHTSTVDPNNNTITFDFNNAGQITAISGANSEIRYAYNKRGLWRLGCLLTRISC